MQGTVWCSKTNFDCFFASIFCRRGHVQGYAIVHIFTFLYCFIWLLMFVQLCTHIEVNCWKRWGSDARRCPVARVAEMHSAFVHCALLQRCFVVKMHWSTVEEMHWCRVALGFTQSDAQRSAPPTVTLHWLFCKSALCILRSIMHYTIYILHTRDT